MIIDNEIEKYKIISGMLFIIGIIGLLKIQKQQSK